MRIGIRLNKYNLSNKIFQNIKSVVDEGWRITQGVFEGEQYEILHSNLFLKDHFHL